MTGMVERVARAMADSLEKDGGGFGYVDAENLDAVVLDGHFNLNVVARSAIEAMRGMLASHFEFDEEGVLDLINDALKG